MFVEGANGVRPIGDGLLEVSDASLNKLIASGDINEIYDVEHTPFARGKFATVRRAMHKQTGVSFAAKFLRRRRRAQCTLKEIRHEIAILLLCADSPHIVKLHSVHETNVETALVLEMATGGELQTLLDEAGSLSEQQTTVCMQEVLRALQFLHKKSIAHLDLKPQNILLCGKRVEDGLKLCDFGISRIVEETGSKVREILGTPDYVAPEVLSYEPLSLKTDIWSVGVLAYVLLSGFSPFGGETKQETFLNISQCNLNFPDDLFQDVSEDAKDFVKSALQVAAEDRMSAVECLEHKWLSESSQPLKNFTKEDSTIAETITATTTTTATENTIPIVEKHSSKSTVENNSTNGTMTTTTIIDTNKSREVDSVSCATSSPSPSPSPAKPNTGFFLHQTPKNGTTLDEVLFSSLNNGFNTTANTNTNTNNGVAFKTNNSVHHHHHHLQQQQQHYNNHHQHHHHHQHQHHNNHSHHNNHQSVEHAKQNAPTVNNSCSSINPNDTTDLLKDYTTNKENINLSKILAAAAANRTTLHNNNNNSINSSNSSNSNGSTNNNNNSSSSSGSTSTTTYEYIDDSVTMSGTAATAQVAAKHESVLFPDAPTTPKVLRKSNQADGETPSCVTLVKQFQMNNGTTTTTIQTTVTETSTAPMSSSSSPSSLPSSTVQATTMRNKFANLTELARNENYRISATAITTAAANGHHQHQHHHHSLGSSALSSALSINTLTDTSVGVSQQHSNSTITISNCLCGADKTANCCCNSSSRAALNYRKKSLAVVDSSILC